MRSRTTINPDCQEENSDLDLNTPVVSASWNALSVSALQFLLPTHFPVARRRPGRQKSAYRPQWRHARTAIPPRPGRAAAGAAVVECAVAGVLRLGCAGVFVLRRVCAAGAGGRDPVDLCRAADPRVW